MARLSPDVRPGQFWATVLLREGNEVVLEILNVYPDGTVEGRVQIGTDLTPWNTVWFLAPKFRRQLLQQVWPEQLPQLPGAVGRPGGVLHPPSPPQQMAPAAPLALAVRPPPPPPRRKPVEELANEALKKALRTGHPSHWKKAWGLFMGDPQELVTGPYEAPFLLWKLETLERAGKVCSEAAVTTRERLADLGFEGCVRPFEPPPQQQQLARRPPPPPPAPARPVPPPEARPAGVPRSVVDERLRKECENIVVKALVRMGVQARRARTIVRDLAERVPAIACDVDALLRTALADRPLPPGTTQIEATAPPAPLPVAPRPPRRPPEPERTPVAPPGGADLQAELEREIPELREEAPAPLPRPAPRPLPPPPPVPPRPTPPRQEAPRPRPTPTPPPPVPPRPAPPRQETPPSPRPAFPIEVAPPPFVPPPDPMAYLGLQGEWSTGVIPSARPSDQTLHLAPAPGDPLPDQFGNAKPVSEPRSGEWTYQGQLLGYFLNKKGEPVTFTQISAELGGASAKGALFSELDTSLWDLVEDSVVEHTTKAPVRFRLTDPEGLEFAMSEAEPPILGIVMEDTSFNVEEFAPEPAQELGLPAFPPLAPAPPPPPGPPPVGAFAPIARVTDRDPQPGERWLAHDGGVTYPVYVVDVNTGPLAPAGGTYLIQGFSGGEPAGATWPIPRDDFVAPIEENPRRRRRVARRRTPETMWRKATGYWGRP